MKLANKIPQALYKDDHTISFTSSVPTEMNELNVLEKYFIKLNFLRKYKTNFKNNLEPGWVSCGPGWINLSYYIV